MNKRHYEHTLPNIRGSLSNTYGALKKMMPKFKVRRYGCKTLGKLYEKLDRYELVMTEKGVANAVRLKY